MRTDRNHLQAISLAMNPIKVASANAWEALPRGSQRLKRKREASEPDSEQNPGEANSCYEGSHHLASPRNTDILPVNESIAFPHAYSLNANQTTDEQRFYEGRGQKSG